eukprot:6183768-Pleurochrysis_carterae.AAC.3
MERCRFDNMEVSIRQCAGGNVAQVLSRQRAVADSVACRRRLSDATWTRIESDWFARSSAVEANLRFDSKGENSRPAIFADFRGLEFVSLRGSNTGGAWRRGLLLLCAEGGRTGGR